MRKAIASLLIAVVLGSSAHGADRQEELFASWEAAKHAVKSLVVQFSLETKDSVYQQTKLYDGTLRLIRSDNGKVFATYEAVERNAVTDERLRWVGLLHDETLYLLNNTAKIAVRIPKKKGDVIFWLERYLSPFVVLLDRRRAAQDSYVNVAGHDDWYSFLTMKPKYIIWGLRPALTPHFDAARAVLMNKQTADIPKDMPRQLWHHRGSQEFRYEIKSWRMNATDAPKLEEFTRPEDRPGWQVNDMPQLLGPTEVPCIRCR